MNVTTATVPVDTKELARAQALRDRAESLRNQAACLEPVLSGTFRRRAAELDLQAWVHEIRAGLPVDELHPAAA